MRNHHVCLPPPHVLEALCQPRSAKAGSHYVRNLMGQPTPEALLESVNCEPHCGPAR